MKILLLLKDIYYYRKQSKNAEQSFSIYTLLFSCFDLSSQEIRKMFPRCFLRRIQLSGEFVFDLLFVSYSPSALQQLCSVFAMICG